MRFHSPIRLQQLLRAICFSASLVALGNAAAGPVDWLIDAVTPGKTTVMIHDGPEHRFALRMRGSMTLTDEADDIASIGGRTTIEDTRGGVSRRLVLQPDGNGGIKRVYYLNKRETAFDADGKRWLADTLKNLVREGAFESEKRIRYLYAKGGADAVIAEIEKIKSGFGRSKYIEGLMKIGMLDDAQFDRLLKTVANNDGTFDKRSQLVALVGARKLTAAQQVGVLNHVAQMDSAFDQRGVLTVLTPKLSAEPAVASAWLATINKVNSDFDVRAIIEEMMKTPASGSQIDLALQATQKFSSDFDRASSLKSILKSNKNLTVPQLDLYLKSAEKIDSDFERKNALTALIEQTALDKAGYAKVLNVIAGMRSDFEISNTLTALARKIPADSELVLRYRQVARKLSDHERGQAEKALDHLNL